MQTVIMECVYQACKVYPLIYAQKQYKDGVVIWEHPMEVHMENGEPNEVYYRWRAKLFACPYPIRYPNGFHHRHTCRFSLWLDDKGNKVKLGYIDARKQIYCKVYGSLARQQDEFRQLQKMLKEG